MFNIEEKIKKWYENQKIVPIVKNEPKEEEVEKIYTTSNKSNTTIRDINDLKNTIVKNNKEYDRLKEEIIYEYENNPKNEYSDESLSEKADKLAETALEDAYNKENLKNKEKINDISEEERGILTDKHSKKTKIEENFDENLNFATDKAIKNGISRSSILDGEKQKYLGEKEGDLALLDLNVEKALESSEIAKDAEEARHKNAINELDNKKEAEKTKQLALLKEERQKLVDEGKISGNYNFDPNYVSPQMVEIQKDTIKSVLSYYMSMDKKQAAKAYEKDVQLQKLLGKLEPAIRLYVTGKGSIER